MRSWRPATFVCLILAIFAGRLTLADTGAQSTPAGKPPATVKAPAPVPAPSPDSDAVAKHAKRTACLKTAKDKKLVGTQKTAFLKDCIGAP